MRAAWSATGYAAAGALISLAVAACAGSSANSNLDAVTTRAPALRFATCMRSHGVPAFPDPTTNGDILKAKVAPLSHGAAFRAATEACHQELPATGRGGELTNGQIALLRSGMVKFAGCMRAAGVTDWPDPTTGRRRRPVFNLTGTNPGSPAIGTDIRRCRHEMTGAIVPYMCTQGHSQSTAGAGIVEICIGGPAYQYTR